MKNKSNKTKLVLIVLIIAILGLFVLTQFANAIGINLTTYSDIIRSLR